MNCINQAWCSKPKHMTGDTFPTLLKVLHCNINLLELIMSIWFQVSEEDVKFLYHYPELCVPPNEGSHHVRL